MICSCSDPAPARARLGAPDRGFAARRHRYRPLRRALRRGAPEGKADEHWSRAEREVRGKTSSANFESSQAEASTATARAGNPPLEERVGRLTTSRFQGIECERVLVFENVLG